MQTYVIRRRDGWKTPEELAEAAARSTAEGEAMPDDIRWIRSYVVEEPDGSLRELPTICVDSSEFVVSKLKDRGTHQAFGVVTNAQDFMQILRLYVERELAARGASSRTRTPAAAL